MGRGRRARSYGMTLKNYIYVYGAVILIMFATCVVVFMVYNKKVKEATAQTLIATEKITDLVPNTEKDTEELLAEASSELSKSIEEAMNNTQNNVAIESSEDEVNEVIPTVTEKQVEEEKPKKVLEFTYPVEGEISIGYAKDNLIFSETLQEWTTHNGIDIKASRTTVVKAAEEGVVVAIKNDPRYGLTIIIEHQDGYKTVYSNLLTTEFVVEDEKVTKGQSLGTVGNSAAFEIADEPHLHFEMLINNEYVDPTLYLK